MQNLNILLGIKKNISKIDDELNKLSKIIKSNIDINSN